MTDAEEDRRFDEQLSGELQVSAGTHFTSVVVARYAARLLAPRPGMVVLDVGAGVGKFCITAAREVPDATFVGVEYRPHLVTVATELARRHALTNVRFVHADALELDWAPYDAFYLFNPFAEHLFDGALAVDHTITFNPERYLRYVDAVQRRLAAARPGTRVVSYHGFGGAPPEAYELADEGSLGTRELELWIKA
jgi:SAM-dependent methyltransferase